MTNPKTSNITIDINNNVFVNDKHVARVSNPILKTSTVTFKDGSQVALETPIYRKSYIFGKTPDAQFNFGINGEKWSKEFCEVVTK